MAFIVRASRGLAHHRSVAVDADGGILGGGHIADFKGGGVGHIVAVLAIGVGALRARAAEGLIPGQNGGLVDLFAVILESIFQDSGLRADMDRAVVNICFSGEGWVANCRDRGGILVAEPSAGEAV